MSLFSFEICIEHQPKDQQTALLGVSVIVVLVEHAGLRLRSPWHHIGRIACTATSEAVGKLKGGQSYLKQDFRISAGSGSDLQSVLGRAALQLLQGMVA